MKYKLNITHMRFQKRFRTLQLCFSFFCILVLNSFLIIYTPTLSLAKQACSRELQAYKSLTNQLKSQKKKLAEAETEYENFVKKQKKRNRKIARRNRKIYKGLSQGIPSTIQVGKIEYGDEAQRYKSLLNSYNSNVNKQKTLYNIYRKCVNDYPSKVSKKYKGKGINKQNEFEKRRLEELDAKIAEKLAEQNQKADEQKQLNYRNSTIKKNNNGVWTN